MNVNLNIHKRWELRKHKIWVDYKGEKIPLAILAKQNNVNYGILRHRIELGWSIEDALTRPMRNGKEIRNYKIN